MLSKVLISAILVLVLTATTCKHVVPPIPIATAGQEKVLEKGEAEVAGAYGGNFQDGGYSDDAANRSAFYGRVRYGVAPKISLGFEGLTTKELTNGKLNFQYQALSFLMFDFGLGLGKSYDANSSGLSLGTTLNAPINRYFGMYMSGRVGASFVSKNKSYYNFKDESQYLLAFGLKGSIGKKQQFSWFSEFGSLGITQLNEVLDFNSQNRSDIYVGIGLSYKLRLKPVSSP